MSIDTAKLYVFVDVSFANLKNLSLQIGYVILYGNEISHKNEDSFEVQGNIVHWSSTKCKRVTRSVLASEIYGMTSGLDIGFVLARTLRTICERNGLPPSDLVICTNSKLLYDCLVQFGTTIKKRLIIDIMAIRQSYEGREI